MVGSCDDLQATVDFMMEHRVTSLISQTLNSLTL